MGILTCTQNNIWSDERSSTRMRGGSPPRIGVNADVVRIATTSGPSSVDDAGGWDDVKIWAEDGFALIFQCPFEGRGLWLIITIDGPHPHATKISRRRGRRGRRIDFDGIYQLRRKGKKAGAYQGEIMRHAYEL